MILSPSNQSGFTLVEIALVMIIIGLLIGVIVAGGKIKENAQVMEMIKGITLYDSSAMKFKELYGDLPGDLRDPSAKLPNCNVAPCSTAGDGDGILDVVVPNAITATDENFVFWNHLLSAGLVSGYKGTSLVAFGEGVPAFDTGGYVVYYDPGEFFTWPYRVGRPHHKFVISTYAVSQGNHGGTDVLDVSQAAKIDKKIDDGLARHGEFQCGNVNCSTFGSGTDSVYNLPDNTTTVRYLTSF